jgi:hypothetical protein
VLLHEDGAFVQQIPDELFECIESFKRTSFDYEEDVTLTLIADGGVVLGIEGGFVLGEVFHINDNTVDSTEFDITDAVKKAAKNDIHSSGNSSCGFRHGRLFLCRFVLGFA